MLAQPFPITLKSRNKRDLLLRSCVIVGHTYESDISIGFGGGRCALTQTVSFIGTDFSKTCAFYWGSEATNASHI